MPWWLAGCLPAPNNGHRRPPSRAGPTVGTAPSPQDDERLHLVESAFGLAELRSQHIEPASDDEERVRELLGRGGIDLVVLVGEHPGEPQVRAAIRSCQMRGLPWIHVHRSLGVTRVRMAIERFLQPDPRADGDSS